MDEITNELEEKHKKKLNDYSHKAARVNFLNEQIEKIEKLDDLPIFAIFAFLMKCLLIESELKQFLCRMDNYLSHKGRSHLVYKKVRYPKEFDNGRYTFESLIKECEKYTGEKLDTLIDKLKRLKDVRNEFNHKLYWTDKNLEALSLDTEEGITLANETLIFLALFNQEFATESEK